MTLGNRAGERTRETRFRTGFIVAVVVAVVLGTIAVVLLSDLFAIGPCNGGIGLAGCPANPGFHAEQLGHSQFVNGSYACSFIVYPLGSLVLYSTSLIVWAETLSHASSNLLSVTLYSAVGSVLSNYSLSGTTWTADQTIEIPNPAILTATSSIDLVGQWLVISDPVTHVTGYNNVQ